MMSLDAELARAAAAAATGAAGEPIAVCVRGSFVAFGLPTPILGRKNFTMHDGRLLCARAY